MFHNANSLESGLIILMMTKECPKILRDSIRAPVNQRDFKLNPARLGRFPVVQVEFYIFSNAQCRE